VHGALCPSNQFTIFPASLPSTQLRTQVWCCPLNKWGLITAGAFAAVAGGIGVIIGATLVAADAADLEVCYSYYTGDIDYTYDPSTGEYTYSYGTSGYSWWFCEYVTRGVLQFVGAGLMIGAAVCTFMFVCGPRYQKHHDQVDRESKNIVSQVVVGGDKKNEKEPETAMDEESEGSAHDKGPSRF
jgi:hypothetical protein